MNDGPLVGKVVIVTGGGRVLGGAINGSGPRAAGARIVATAAREVSEVERVAAEADDLAGADRVLPLVADVTPAEDCARVVEAALKSFWAPGRAGKQRGPRDEYVSPRFLTEPARFWEAPADVWRLVIDTNVNGPFYDGPRRRAAHAPRRLGANINISMNHETMRRAGFSPYGPSKAALESETVIWAQYLAGTGVTVNALLPGRATTA